MKNIDQIKTLVSRFDRNLNAYRSGHYNETQVRLEFIDPLFKALGWDIHNEAGIAEAYKDVVHEATVKIGGATKAPDYSFRVSGTRKFFVEAKKPSIDIAHDIHPAYQLRRYAWSAKLPLSILTDFEEFAVYDCRIKPQMTDKAATARIMYFTFCEYEERWNEITDIFSRDAVWKGDFDRFVESKRKKRGTSEVDSAFLKEIENWRELLARNIALRNPDLTVYDMNFAVQRTIDRIIFLRICEDRSIERYGQLREQLNGDGIYSKLCRLFKRADERFNSGLFHFRKEKDRESTLDTLTLNLAIDDKPLKDIITHLYYPDCPYEFSVLSTEILGHVYEQFLGKVIRLTTAHRAKVEEKPEVRKAGGVYYTPTYIVDYIVKNTVGKLLEDGIATSSRGTSNNVKEVKPKEVSKLKIVDPACGSGSFLIGAYQYLLDWHRDYYIKNGHGHFKDKIQPAPGGDWQLTTTEKKRILLNNIYGVDIDPQAVEVTKLSLLLKVLEGESEETIESQLKFFHERALPDLSRNIKCGNSLIGPDFYENEQLILLDEEERYRINAFDWEAEFPEVFSRQDAKDAKGQSGPGRRSDSVDGFDVVIGNPPYVVVKGGRYTGFEESKEIINYYKSRYRFLQQQANIYIAFLELSNKLVRESKLVGMIVPNTILTNDFCEKIRSYLTHNTTLISLCNEGNVFQNAVVEGLIVIYRKAKTRHSNIIETKIQNIYSKVSQSVFTNLTFRSRFLINLTPSSIKTLFRINEHKDNLGNKCEVWRGLTTGNDSKYLSREPLDEYYHPIVQGRHISRFRISDEMLFVKYVPTELDRPRPRRIFEIKQKLISKFVGKDLCLAYDDEKRFVINTACIIFPRESTKESIKYFLGILNSRMMNFYFQSMFTDYRKTFPIVKSGYLEQLPIHTIDFSDPRDKSRHDKMVKLVDRMLDLHKQLSKAKTHHDREVLQRQITSMDRQIDRLVYELYDLTEEEIHLIEETADK